MDVRPALLASKAAHDPIGTSKTLWARLRSRPLMQHATLNRVSGGDDGLLRLAGLAGGPPRPSNFMAGSIVP